MEIIFPDEIILKEYKVSASTHVGGQAFGYQAEWLKCPKGWNQKWRRDVFIKQYHDLSPDEPTLRRIALFFELYRKKLSDSLHYLCLPNKVGIDKNSIIAIYPWIKGEILADILKKSLTHPDKIRISIGLINAIKSLHQAGIAHLDLKPDNLVVYKEKGKLWIQIIDLDGSKIDDICIRNKNIHTPEFCSPEQCNGTKPKLIGQKSDIFSLGRILLIVLTGVDPYNSVHSYQKDIIAGNYSIPSNNFHKDVIGVLRQSLNPSPQKRPSIRRILYVFSKHFENNLLTNLASLKWDTDKTKKLVQINKIGGSEFSRMYHKDIILTFREFRGSGLTSKNNSLLKIIVREEGIILNVISKRDKFKMDNKEMEFGKNYWLLSNQIISINDHKFSFNMLNY